MTDIASTFDSLSALNAALLSRPPLIAGAGRVVLGEGPLRAAVAFVGEQPGDAEDIAGRPFVGPAGRCSTGRWRKRESTGRSATSPTR
ncbi:MAG: hypothetical protein U1E46_01020 [Hyphomicrobiales bacterium]